MQAAENLLDGRRQAESMKPKRLAWRQRRARFDIPGLGPQLYISPIVRAALRSHPLCEFERFACLIKKRFSVVSEGQ
jgi:hypothetical protein